MSARRAKKNSTGSPSSTGTIRSLRIHVLFEEKSADGAHLARALFHWFRGDPGDMARCGSGIPVEYHIVRKEGPECVLPEFDPEELHFVIVLLDDIFVLAPKCRRIRELLDKKVIEKGKPIEHIVLLPVGLDDSATSVPGIMSERNFVRLDAVDVPKEETAEQRSQRRENRLLSLVTQFAARMIASAQDQSSRLGFQRFDPDKVPRKLSIFVSHAKADGRAIAEYLRMEILRHGQLEAFFDEADIAIGSQWEGVLKDAASHGNGAMLVLFTDRYPSRPWCVREIRSARFARERSVRVRRRAALGTVYSFVPVRILDALSHEDSFMLSEFAGIPTQRYDPARVHRVLDALVRDVVLQAHFGVLAWRAIRDDHGDLAMASAPDVFTLASIASALRARDLAKVKARSKSAKRPPRRTTSPQTMLIPATGIEVETLEAYRCLFPQWTFRTLDEIEVSR